MQIYQYWYIFYYKNYVLIIYLWWLKVINCQLIYSFPAFFNLKISNIIIDINWSSIEDSSLELSVQIWGERCMIYEFDIETIVTHFDRKKIGNYKYSHPFSCNYPESSYQNLNFNTFVYCSTLYQIIGVRIRSNLQW